MIRRAPSTFAVLLVLAVMTAPPGRAAQEAGPVPPVPTGAPTGAPAPAPAPEQEPAPAAPRPAPLRLELAAPVAPLRLGQRCEIVVSGVKTESRLEVASLDDGLDVGTPRLVRDADGDHLVLPLRVTREGELALDLTVVTGAERQPIPRVKLVVALDQPPGQAPAVAAALPPVPVPPPAAALWPLAAALGAALLVLGVWIVRASRVVVPPPAPPRPADVLAAEDLARLRGRLPRTREEVPAFTVDVSAVLRTYIERRFGVRAPESTTEEFLSVAGGRAELMGHRDPLARFLSACDLVKFAGHRPEPGSVVPLLDTAEGFVETTRA